VTSDDTSADNQLLGDLRARLARATEADPLLGTVELTTWELAHVLELHDRQDSRLRAGEFTQGRLSHVVRKRNATLDAVTLAVLAGESGPLADTISDILHGGR